MANCNIDTHEDSYVSLVESVMILSLYSQTCLRYEIGSHYETCKLYETCSHCELYIRFLAYFAPVRFYFSSY